jgi:hypothetical protein
MFGEPDSRDEFDLNDFRNVAKPKKEEEDDSGKIKRRIQVALAAIVVVVCVGAFVKQRYGNRLYHVPDIQVDARAKEVGVTFSNWRWENRYQLYCSIECTSDDFINYEVRYIPFAADGTQLPGGSITYKPLHKGENGSGMIKFGKERDKMERLKLVLVKGTSS